MKIKDMILDKSIPLVHAHLFNTSRLTNKQRITIIEYNHLDTLFNLDITRLTNEHVGLIMNGLRYHTKFDMIGSILWKLIMALRINNNDVSMLLTRFSGSQAIQIQRCIDANQLNS